MAHVIFTGAPVDPKAIDQLVTAIYADIYSDAVEAARERVADAWRDQVAELLKES